MTAPVFVVAVAAALMPLVADAQVTAAGRKPPVARTRDLGRIYLSLNALVPVAGDEVRDSFTLRRNAEDGRLDVDYGAGRRPGLDLAGGVLLTPHLGVGAGVTLLRQSAPASVRATIPHPFLFAQPRPIEGRVDGVEQTFTAFHVQARIVIPAGRRIQMTVFGGPTFFRGGQQVVHDVEYDETYPYDTASFARALLEDSEASKVGAHGGADVGYFFTRRVGVGVGAQYAAHRLPLSSGHSRALDVRIGGVQAAAGLRLRF